MDCPKCGAANLDRATKCDRCEAELPRPTRARGWLFQHPLLVAVTGAVVTGLFGLFIAVINSGSGGHTLMPVDRTQVDGFVPGPNDPHTPDRDLSPAFRNEPPLTDQTTDGTRPGVYGRSGDGVSCDVDKHIAYLTAPAHTRQATAWAGAAHVRPGDITAYFRSLTPVRLRFDTRVTNYDYRDGHADGYQAVLQAGTAVLVDDHGVPRAKCNCGNPLMEPTGPATTTDDVDDFAANPEEAWDGFAPQQVATVRSGPHVDQFVLVDLDDGQVYRRGVGSTGAGDAPVGQGDPACATWARATNCGGPGPQATAQDAAQLEKTLRRLVKAVHDGDCRTLVDSMSAATVQQFDLGSEQNLAACRATFDALNALGGITIDDMKIVSQTGAHAVVSTTVTVQGQSTTEEDQFVRENGNWKVDLHQG